MLKVDLHGIKHEHVRDLVIRKIEDVWGTNTDVIFITGMSERMKKIVITVLKEYKLKYTIGDSYNFGFIRTII